MPDRMSELISDRMPTVGMTRTWLWWSLDLVFLGPQQAQGKGRASVGRARGLRESWIFASCARVCESTLDKLRILSSATGPHFSAKSFLFDRASMGFSAAQQQNQTWNPRKTLKQLNFHRVFNGVLLLSSFNWHRGRMEKKRQPRCPVADAQRCSKS